MKQIKVKLPSAQLASQNSPFFFPILFTFPSRKNFERRRILGSERYSMLTLNGMKLLFATKHDQNSGEIYAMQYKLTGWLVS